VLDAIDARVTPTNSPSKGGGMSSTEDRTGELREGYAEVGEVKLHYVEAGDGPLVVLLHGFPEFWYGWRLQIKPLAAAGFRVVAPTCAATTCRRGRTASRPTTPTS
jgi:hypothetical protein